MSDQPSRYAHLKGRALEVVGLTNDERIEHILLGAWMPLPHAEKALKRMQRTLTFPRGSITPRMPNILLVGPSHNGKTTILNRFMEQHPRNRDPAAEVATCPVLMVQAPPGPSRGELFSKILYALEVPWIDKSSADVKYIQILKLFKNLGVKVLVIDEIQHMIAGSVTKQQEYRNALKSLSSEARISLVVAGVEDAYNAIGIDPQWASRFENIELPRWEMGKALGSLMATFEATTPLRLASNLKSEELVMEVASKSEGVLGDVFDLLRVAAIHSIESGEEHITRGLIRGLPWTPPSRRGKHR